MTKRAFILFALLLAVPAIRAQYLVTKVGGGLAKNYGSSRVVGSYKVGLAYEWEVAGNWSLEAGAYYYGKGRKYKDESVPLVDLEGRPVLDEEGHQRRGTMNRTTNAQYVSVPVTAHYYVEVADMKYLVLTAGPYVAVGVGGRDKVRGDAEQTQEAKRYYYSHSTFSVGGTRRFDAGIEAGLAFQWGRNFTVGAEADFGLATFRRPSARNVSGLVTFSYRFRLGD